MHPTRHWADHPGNLVEHKATYAEKGTIVFEGIDFHQVWFALMIQDYGWLSRAYLPLDGKKKDMAKIEALLRERTRAFTEEQVFERYGKHTTPAVWEMVWKTDSKVKVK